MDIFESYVIPVKGLDKGVHQYQFNLDEHFFTHFETSPIRKSQLQVQVTLDKREGMLLWAFEVKGTIESVCDRCMEAIQLPIHQSHDLIIKYGSPNENSGVVFIERDQPTVQLAPYLYEFSCLSLPIVHTYACEDDEQAPCNDEVLDILDAGESSDENGNTNTDLGDQLGNLDLNFNK